MRTLRHVPVLFALATAFLLSSGCKKKTVDGPAGTVSGKVTFKGNAVPEGCVVIFSPESGGESATGTVDSGGSFKLYYKGGTDIPVGKYKVNVTPAVVNETPQEAMERSMRKEKLKGESEVPQKYRRPETSGETFDVKEGKNTYSLDMKD
jgi:hypothetical protein